MTVEYRVGDAVTELDSILDAALIHLDDAWSRPGRQGAFGVTYPTHDLEVTFEVVDACWNALVDGGWLILDADDWLAPRVESYIREEYGDVTSWGDYQGGGYRRRGAVTYVDVSGDPDRSTAGQYLSNGGYPVIFAHKADTNRRCTASARQIARQPRRVEAGYPYGRGSIKPVGPYRQWLGGLVDAGEHVVVPCAGTAPAAIAAEGLWGTDAWVTCIDCEHEARKAYHRRRDALLTSKQSTLGALGGEST